MSLGKHTLPFLFFQYTWSPAVLSRASFATSIIHVGWITQEVIGQGSFHGQRHCLPVCAPAAATLELL
jgi:hypothetical protein